MMPTCGSNQPGFEKEILEDRVFELWVWTEEHKHRDRVKQFCQVARNDLL
jgi:hypothetical protein